ncbi:hypothetical protein KY284_007750 [Solanum tuberosum]|nr:hypothetical protein KY284_007750 [Solanum tuberosum]
MESSSNLSGVFEEDELNTTRRSHPKRSREVLKSMQQQLNEDLNMSNEVQSGQVSGEDKQQKWANLFTKNRLATHDMALNYIPPSIINGETVVHLEKSEVDLETAKWRYALVAYVMGDLPGYNFMNRYITKNWGNIGQPDLFMHEDGYYIIKFQNMKDMQEVLYTRPHIINNRPIILKKWSVDFDFTKEFLTEIPLWFSFPNLPMNCWSCNSLSRIASAIGKPIYVDECITKQTTISYARMLIETNVTKPLPKEITVHDPN